MPALPHDAVQSRSTKIVATIGNVSSDPVKLRQLHDAGVNVFRLNFSHGTQAEQGARIDAIRAMEVDTGMPTCILADFQGPKFRVGSVEDDVVVTAGSQIVFDMKTETGNAARVGLPHPEIFKSMYPGARLLMDDGKLVFKVVKIDDARFTAEVIFGGPLKSNKGVNLPDVILTRTHSLKKIS